MLHHFLQARLSAGRSTWGEMLHDLSVAFPSARIRALFSRLRSFVVRVFVIWGVTVRDCFGLVHTKLKLQNKRIISFARLTLVVAFSSRDVLPWFGDWFGLVGFSFNANLGPQRPFPQVWSPDNHELKDHGQSHSLLCSPRST